jgi:hypothetical protein
LSNRGVGPATIDRFVTFVDSTSLPDASVMRLGEALHAIGLPQGFYIYIPTSGDVLAAGEEVALLELPPVEVAAHYRAVAGVLSRLSFEVHCRSLYGEHSSVRRTGTGQLSSERSPQAPNGSRAPKGA